MKYLDWDEEYERGIEDGINWFQLTPLKDIHLRSSIRWELEANGNIMYVWIFISSAILIILIACINFMNLATARFNRRAREVGMRKTLGASRRKIIVQFLTESFLQTFLAVIMAAMLIELLLPAFGNLTGKDFSIIYSHTGLYVLILTGFTILISILAGSYPAFYLSSFVPIEIIRKQVKTGLAAIVTRKALVVFQFSISIFLVIGTLIIFDQLNYLRNENLGFDKENIIVLPVKDGNVRAKIDAIKESLLQHQNIISVSAVSNIPGERFNNNSLFLPDGNIRLSCSETSIDYDFFKTLDIPIVEGRRFRREFGMDSSSRFIVNETAVRQLGLSSALNQRIIWWDDDSTYNGEIIGVARDFHYRSLHDNLNPLIMMIKPSEYNYLLVKISPQEISKTVSLIREEWLKFDRLFTFEYSFLDDDFDKRYRNEERMGAVYRIFALLAMIIASLGLFGLSTFSAEQKIKEIGVRKAHGASSASILMKFLRDFSGWILLAFIIASPAAYFIMNSWLNNFAFQVTPSIWIFIFAVAITEIIAMLAVSYQSAKASRGNLVDALRHE